MADDDHEVTRLLAEQVAYYRSRAGEYDLDMWADGNYDPLLAAEVAELEDWVSARPVAGRVLELACGTGHWTPWLADRATAVVAVDSSPEMIEIVRERVGTSRAVHFVVGDVYDVDLDGRFDVVFFSFFLSHVPRQRFDAFWQRIRGWLARDGIAIFLDAAPLGSRHETPVAHPTIPLVRRRLRDGSEHRVIKVFRTATELQQMLTERGWTADVGTTGRSFLRGTARPHDRLG